MGSDPHRNRLSADYDKLLEIQANSSLVQILETSGIPPEKYVILLKCKGITRLDPTGAPIYSEAHRLSVELPPTYPRNIPVLRMLTPVWHPNINSEQGWICLGHEGERGYAPSMSLPDLVVMIIQMIRYENYSREFYLNQKAFEWAKQNQHLFPLDTSSIMNEPVDIKILGTDADTTLLDEINIL